MLARDNTSLVRLAQKTPIHAAPKELSNNTRLELPGTNAVPRGLRVGSARRQAPPNKYGEKNLRHPPRTPLTAQFGSVRDFGSIRWIMTPTKASQSNTDFTTLVTADSKCLRETTLRLSDLLKRRQSMPHRKNYRITRG